MTIKLESGKYYRNRNGDVVGPVKVSGSCYIFPFTDGAYTYREDGKWSEGEESLDLIEEVPNPNATPLPSDYHLQRALDFMDSLNSVEDVKKYPELCTCTINVARYIAQHEPEPVDPVLLEARRMVEKYYNYQENILDDGLLDDSGFMKLVIDALRFDVSTLK